MPHHKLNLALRFKKKEKRKTLELFFLLLSPGKIFSYSFQPFCALPILTNIDLGQSIPETEYRNGHKELDP